MISTLRKLGALLVVCGWTVSASYAGPDAGKTHYAAGEAVAGSAAEAAENVAGAHGEDAHGEEEHGFNPLDIQKQMFWLFLGVFLVAFFILKKFAFGPILAALDERESQIRDSVESAERIQRELKELEETRKGVIAEADAKAKEVLEEARKGAVDAARTIEQSAKDEAKILVDNARREIAAAEAQAEAALRAESARLAVELAGKVLGENLDDTKNRELVDRLISEI